MGDLTAPACSASGAAGTAETTGGGAMTGAGGRMGGVHHRRAGVGHGRCMTRDAHTQAVALHFELGEVETREDGAEILDELVVDGRLRIRGAAGGGALTWRTWSMAFSLSVVLQPATAGPAEPGRRKAIRKPAITPCATAAMAE